MVKFYLTFVLSVCLLTQNLFAALDLNPPLWRGDDGTTMALWEFSTDDPTPIPDIEHNPYGTADIEVFPAAGHAWQELYKGRSGMWPLSGRIEIGIDNDPNPRERKEIRVQLVWRSKGGTPSVTELDHGATAELIGDTIINEEYNWHHSTFQMFLFPNPDYETIQISGAIRVDELVIDTICIPEPASLLLLALPTLAYFRKQHKRLAK